MSEYEEKGKQIRENTKELVLDFMNGTTECKPLNEGMTLAEIFRECGLDWGHYENATSSNQQYWLVALMREFEKEGIATRDLNTKKWRLVK